MRMRSDYFDGDSSSCPHAKNQEKEHFVNIRKPLTRNVFHMQYNVRASAGMPGVWSVKPQNTLIKSEN